MNQIEQSLASCTRNPTNDSSQILDGLLDQVMFYEATFDPKLHIFYQALFLRIKEKYDEKKEEEPSPHQYTPTAPNNINMITTQTQNVTEVTLQPLQQEAVDYNDINKLNRNAQIFHPRVDHRKLCTIHELEEDSDAEVVDDGLFDQLEAMKKDSLKDAENEKKAAKKLANKLNKNIPKISRQNKEKEVTENALLSPPSCSSSSSSSSSSFISSTFTAITQSPSSSEKSSISVSSTNSISSSSLSSSVITTSSLPISPYINNMIPNIYASLPLPTNMNCMTTPNLINPLCSIPVISTPSSSVPNKQYDQTTLTNQFDTVSQLRNDIGSQHKNINDNKNVCYRRKFNNAAKRNCYISKEMISRMMTESIEVFETDHVNDEKLAFGYYKESVAMQINDGQINDSFVTKRGFIIIINIDLHFKDGDIMYLVANENDPEFRHKVRWRIIDFMHGHQIYNEYGIPSDKLPLSSRNMDYFQKAMNMPPTNVSSKIVKHTIFKNLPEKTSKRQSNGFRSYRTRISENDLKYYCFKNWNKSPMIPVVVIKGKKQCIEWKKFIRIYDDGYNGYNNSEELWIGISMRYYPSNKHWKIECMDYDAGRIFYQHRLCGNTKHNISYNQLCKFITTTLNIC